MKRPRIYHILINLPLDFQLFFLFEIEKGKEKKEKYIYTLSRREYLQATKTTLEILTNFATTDDINFIRRMALDFHTYFLCRPTHPEIIKITV